MKTRRSMSLSGAFLMAALLVLTPAGAGADAGPDLVLRPGSGPVGTTIEVFSPDQLAMDADQCRSERQAEGTNESDAYEVRWSLGVLPVSATDAPLIGGSGTVVTPDVEPVAVLATGVVPTQVGVPWRTTVTVPATAEPGQRLAVWADCWRSGPEVAGGEKIWFSYYYLGVFTVTGTSPTTTGGPVASAPAPVPAAPVPAAPTYTG